jgi:hypothetical protein
MASIDQDELDDALAAASKHGFAKGAFTFEQRFIRVLPRSSSDDASPSRAELSDQAIVPRVSATLLHHLNNGNDIEPRVDDLRYTGKILVWAMAEFADIPAANADFRCSHRAHHGICN